MRTETVEGPPDRAQEFYTWWVPGAPIRAHVSLEVVRGIENYLEHDPPPFAGSVPKSGLLLGRIDGPGDTKITGFQPLSIARPAEVEAALAGLKHSSEDLRAVGFFRTHDKDRLCLGPADLSLAEALFQNPGCVFLLISPSETGPSNAGFFFWDGAGINGDFCFLEFPLDAHVLVAIDAAEPATFEDRNVAANQDHPSSPHLIVEPLHFRCAGAISLNPPTNEPAPHKTNEPESPISWILSLSQSALPDRCKATGKHTPLKISKALWGLMRTILTFALGVSISLVYSGGGFSRLATPAAHGLGPRLSSPLGLRVENQGDWLRVSWDRKAPDLRSATQGLLEIKDGSERREARLDPNQLADCSLLYRPASGDVTLLLQLRGKRGLVSESIRVLAADRLSSPAVVSPKTESSSPQLPFHPVQHSKSAS
jgi:hypothetical protein